jgi:hypothetical protein
MPSFGSTLQAPLCTRLLRIPQLFSIAGLRLVLLGLFLLPFLLLKSRQLFPDTPPSFEERKLAWLDGTSSS